MTDNFYRAFEDMHRGSRDLIKDRLKAYLPFLNGILDISEQPEAIDLGCGRGEWLEYLRSLGFKAQGVDLDDGMLEACQQMGLTAKKGEMIEFLRTVPDASCMLISAFHVVEHISFDDLRVFVKEACRVLQPGGLLMMETPNPENIVVATRNFYLDPTHNKPIPPDLLHFVSEHAGFNRSKIVRLQEAPGLRENPHVSILDVFAGASPDYAIVAQQLAEPAEMAKFDSAFGQNYGLSLENLLGRWDGHFSAVEQKLNHVEHKAEEAAKAYDTGFRDGTLQTELQEAQRSASRTEQKIEMLETELRELSTQLANTQSQIASVNDALEQNDKRLLQALEAEFNALLSSKSWRITWPLRKLMQFTRWILSLLTRRIFVLPKTAARYVFAKLIRFAIKYPGIRLRATHWLNNHPRLKDHIRLFAQRRGLLPRAPHYTQPSTKTAAKHANQTKQVDLSNLTLHARQIYKELKTAVENNKEHKQCA